MMLKSIQALMQAPPGLEFDFSQPAGEAALTPQHGISWQVFANPVSLFIGGVSAVLLELAEPSVRSGVWDHSSFQRDPLLRLRRTGFAAMMTVYGPRSAAEEMIARVVRIHDHVQGVTPAGAAYYANDPRLLDWVQATATFGFTEAHHTYVRPFSMAEKDAAFAESQVSARLYGATGAPRTWAEWEALLATTAPGLERSDILRDFMSIMSQAAILPAPLRWVQRLLVRAAVSMTPEPVRSLPELRAHGLRRGELALVRAMAKAAALLPMPESPASKSAQRLAPSR